MSQRRKDNGLGKCKRCNTLSDQLSLHNLCVKCQKKKG